MKRFMLLLALALLLPQPASGADPGDAAGPESTHRLDDVVVSATRSEVPVWDAPQDVTVLTHEEIMASPFDRVEDIVRSIPGVFNFRHYGMQTNGIVSPLIMRGAGKNRVLLLVDGVPQNDNFNNAIAWVAWGHIPKEVIERIEIVRGPTSAMYGSEGLGGIIHIITKSPIAPGPQLTIKGEVAGADTHAGTMAVGHGSENTGFMLAGGYEDSDGYYMTDQVEDYNIKRYRKTGRIFGKFSHRPDAESELSIAALYYDHEMGKGREFFYDELRLDQYWANYTRTLGRIDFKGLLYLNRSDKTAYQDTAANNYSSLYRIENLPASDTWGADLQLTTPLFKGVALTAGAAFKSVEWKYNEDYPGSTRDAGADGSQQFISPFANLDMRLLDGRLIANLGARYDRIRTSDGTNWDTKPEGGLSPYSNDFPSTTASSFSPKAGLAFHPDALTTLRVSAGKGFRAPNLFELYKVHVRQGGRYYRQASPDLEPEEIWSYDVGVDRFLLPELFGRLTLYQSFARDYIGDRLINSYQKNGKTYNEFTLDNISRVDIYGLESELQWYPRDYLTLFANYTYNISEVDKDLENSAIEGNYLVNDPRHKLHLGTTFNQPEVIRLTVLVNYYGKIYYDMENTMKNDGFWTVDAALVKPLTDHWTVYVNAENILNRQFPITLSATGDNTIAPGIILSGGVKFEF